MSAWLARAIAAQRCGPPVPLVSLAPIAGLGGPDRHLLALMTLLAHGSP